MKPFTELVPSSPRARRALRFAVVSLLAAGAAGVVASRPSEEPVRRLLLDHEEGSAKRAASRAAAIGRASRGFSALSGEGVERGYDVLSYDLSLELDPAVSHLAGRVEVRIAAMKGGVPSVTLDLSGSYRVTEALRDGHPVVAASVSGGKLVLPLDPPLAKEERTTLSVAYEGTPPANGALVFWSRDGELATSTVAEPYDAPTFWPCVDDVADKAVATVRATVPAGYVAASAGLATVATLPDGRKTYSWTLPQPVSTYLVSICVARYVALEDTYVSLDGTRTMPVTSYFLPQHAERNRSRNQAIPGHIATLASLFGEYPYLDTKYGIVEAYFSGGMEHPTMTSIGAAQLGNASRDLTTLLVHELAHQWWGDTVTMRTWDDIWLNEGFATYAEVLYAEKAQGAAPGALLTSSYDDGLYAGALSHSVVVPVDDPFRYTAAVYDKGGWFLHMLRRTVGDQAFFAGLRTYLARHGRGSASRGDLRADLEEVTGTPLKQLFDQWLETPYRPRLRATYRAALDGSQATVRVLQTQPHSVVHPVPDPGDVRCYQFPLVVRLTHPDGSWDEARVVVTEADQSFTLENPGRKPVSGIVLDPAGDLLKVVESTGPAV